MPTTIDYFGFDHYGIYDVSTDANYLAWLDTLESKRSAPNQKIILVFDEEWNASYWPGGWTSDSMETVLGNYYKLALADTNVAALVGFTWPGIALGWLGARSLPQHVINKSVQIGKLIKANYNPCTAGIKENEELRASVYPNPFTNNFTFKLPGEAENFEITIYSGTGEKLKELKTKKSEVNLKMDDVPSGIYFYCIRSSTQTYTGKLIKN